MTLCSTSYKYDGYSQDIGNSIHVLLRKLCEDVLDIANLFMLSSDFSEFDNRDCF